MIRRSRLSSRICSGRMCRCSQFMRRTAWSPGLAHGRGHHPSPGSASSRSKIAICRPSRMTRTRSLIASTSGRSDEIMMMPMPSRGELADHGVHLGLGADVDAARRLVEDEQRGLRVQPLAQHHLLLVAAGELGDRQVDRGRADRQALAEGLGGARSPRRVRIRPRPVEIALQDRQRDVGGDRHRQRQAELAAVLGDIGDADAPSPRAASGW